MIAFTDPALLNDLNSIFTTASDIYSLGVVMWSISSGKFPFENFTNQTDLVNRIVTENIRENSVNGTPKEYLDLYQRCWRLDPEERPSAQDVYTQLKVILQKESHNVDGVTDTIVPNGEVPVIMSDVTNIIVQNDEIPVNTLNQNSSKNLQEAPLDEKKIPKVNRFCKLFCCGRNNHLE
ncbi:kinase-like domain-containing protein [Gigaspora rosea]|uniref:Kinase-like domain-containing protein n=1 Tax=Gigaspora rosea TaxID=44941 RepID=A0A397UCF9_9GLOM|nr:kinase-like domain-containing protein [Gigaspora rosea]